VANRGSREWTRQMARLDRWGCGYAFALSEPPGAPEPADVVGTLRAPADPAAIVALAARALDALPPAAAPDDEIVALARNPLARWRTRQTAPAA
jgi:hypothetical protein